MKLKILLWLSILNLIGILGVYILSFMTKNNHYAISIDVFFIASSIALLIFALIFRNIKVILISLLSIVLGIGMNILNISISYQKWIEREQPELGEKYHL